MKDYIKIGLEKGYISLNEDMSRITYLFQNNKEYAYNNQKTRYRQRPFCG